MTIRNDIDNQILEVGSFQDLISTPFQGTKNALCWKRKLTGDFEELVEKIELNGNITTIEPEELLELVLTKEGQLARAILLEDFKLLEEHGGAPVLNVIRYYDKDDSFFPTDVYSWHVDRSPIPTSTFLCTYYGDSSDILPNSKATLKVSIPEIRTELKQLQNEQEEDFETFLTENFFDLHYQAAENSDVINLGIGHLWRLAVDHPNNPVLPCVHRAPKENSGKLRLLLIC